MSLLIYPKFSAQDLSGVNLSGGFVYFYESGTSTPKDTYSDPALTTANTNPVILNSRGEADIYLSGEYKIVLKDADDAEVWTEDGFSNSLLSADDSVQSYANVAALRAITAAPAITRATIKGYYTDGDGGAIPGGYYWDASSTETDNGGTILKVTAITTGRFKGIYSGAVNVKWFGAKEDGSTDDLTYIQAAFNAADGGAVIISARSLVSGVLYIDDALATGSSGISVRAVLGEPSSNPKYRTTTSRIYSTATTEYIIHSKEPNVLFKDISFQYSTNDIYTAVYLENNTTAEDVDATFDNCWFSDADKCIHLVGRGLDVHNCGFESSNTGIYLDFPASIDASADFGQQSDDAFRGIAIQNNRFHSMDLSCIANIGAQAGDVLGMNIADNQVDGGSLVFFRGGSRHSKFSGNVIHNIAAGGYAYRFTLAVTDTVINGHNMIGKAASIAVQADLPDYFMRFESTADRVVINGNKFNNSDIGGIHFVGAANNISINANGFKDASQNSNVRRCIYFTAAANHISIKGNNFSQPTGTALDYFIGYNSTFLDVDDLENTYDATRHSGVTDKGIPVLANSATPSIEGSNDFLTGGTTTITDLLNGHTGQIVRIVSEHAITITDGTNIFMSGSANFVMKATDTLTLQQQANGNFVEVARSVN